MNRARIRRWLIGGALVALIANLFVIGLYVWGRDGQRTVVTVERVDGAFRIETDGKGVLPNVSDESARVPVDAPPTGTVTFTVPVAVSSLPNPNGIDSVTITDTDGNVLLHDDFDFFNVANWQVVSGDFEIHDGVLTAKLIDAENTIQARDRSFGDVKVSVTYRNSRGGTIGTYVTDSGGAYYHFDLHRDFANFMDVFRDGQRTGTPYGGFIRTAPSQTLRSIAFMVTRPYPYLVLALAAGFLLSLALNEGARHLAPRFEGKVRFPALPARLAGLRKVHPLTLVAVALAIVVFYVAQDLNQRYYGAVPHVPDEVAYIFGAKLLAHGKVMVDMPPLHDLFYFYFPNFMYERGDQWGSPYPFGHPLALAAGEIVGAIRFVPAIVGAVCVLAMYSVGRHMYGRRTAILAALLLAGSPFFLMQSSNFMSHSTCAMYTLLSLLFILKRDRPLPYGFLAGAFFGLAINTHTLDVVILIPPFGLLLLSYLRERDERRAAILHIGGFVAGALLLGVAMGLFTHALTGKFFGAAYAQGDTSELLGFKNGHTLDIGIRNEQSQLIALLLVFNGWPAFVGLAFVLLPFLLGTRNPWDWFCLACALLPILVYILYRYSGVYEGPRYWFEAVPFLIFLTARGVEIAAVRLNDAVSRFNALLSRAMPERAGYGRGQAGITRTYPGRVSTGFIPAYALVLVLFVIGSGGWLFNKNDPQDLALVPYQANAIRGVFDVDDRLARLADETDLHNALVLVKPCGVFSSIHCYGTVFIRNKITFDGDVVWMRYEEGRVGEAIAAFPGREVYIANWDPEASLEVYDPSVNR